MKTIGLAKYGMFDVNRWRVLLSRVFEQEDFTVEQIDMRKEYDFIVLDGGEDVSPELYGQDLHPSTHANIVRDLDELDIFTRYEETPTKFVGICRGQQFLNVALGGTLIQDLWSIGLNHSHLHDICNIDSTNFSRVFGDIIHVNSMHHQAVDKLGYNLIITCIHPELETIEGIESIDDKVRAVQFHPEMMHNELGNQVLKYLFRESE